MSNWQTEMMLVGLVPAAVVLGPYFMEIFQRPRPCGPEHVSGKPGRSVNWRGLVWAVTLPVTWVLLYWAFIANVWLSLGRWPRFGEKVSGWNGWVLSLHDEMLRRFLAALVGSLCVAAVVLLVCLFLRRWRHVALYTICYAVAVGLAFGALFLAPGEFLNWYFD